MTSVMEVLPSAASTVGAGGNLALSLPLLSPLVSSFTKPLFSHFGRVPVRHIKSVSVILSC